MKCPVCKRELAPTLSICFACGAMVNDTVREELETKIARVSGNLRMPESVPVAKAPDEPAKPFSAPPVMPVPAQPATPTPAQPAASRPFTTHLPPKKTSPTLVDFQPKNQTLPDWRLQLQNAVRQRTSTARDGEPEAQPAIQRAPATRGATALKAEPAPAVEHANDKVAAALKRIEASRQAFLSQNGHATPAPSAKPVAARNYPFNVVTKSAEPAARAPQAASPAPAVKPKLVSSLRIEKKAYDTNKLPPIPQPAKLSSSLGVAVETAAPRKIESSFIDEPLPEIEEVHAAEFEEQVAAEPFLGDAAEEIDDLPSFSTRFAAGLFDVILAGAGATVVLSPFIMGSGSWFSFSAVLAFGGTLSIFLFLYMTASLAWWGRTFGMRIFSLELIDIEANAYPTTHQAAVSSAVYILSILFAGAGFLTVLFNEERRAVHDIVSGTLLVREI